MWVAVTGAPAGEARRVRRLLAAVVTASGLLLLLAGSVTATGPAGPHNGPRDHVWITSLGIDRTVHLFPCPRERPPDDFVYAWGCAGANNVYLMGHAHSVFKPLHDAYVRDRLSDDLRVVYADGSGIFHVYRIAWWRVTRPTPDAAWAWAPQDRPSMTLQTCVGRTSERRLMVRLVEVTLEPASRSPGSLRTAEPGLRGRLAPS
jgi:hypothetical protein